MPCKVVWLDQAKDDLRGILEYLRPRNPDAAVSYIIDLEDAYTRLE